MVGHSWGTKIKKPNNQWNTSSMLINSKIRGHLWGEQKAPKMENLQLMAYYHGSCPFLGGGGGNWNIIYSDTLLWCNQIKSNQKSFEAELGAKVPKGSAGAFNYPGKLSTLCLYRTHISTTAECSPTIMCTCLSKSTKGVSMCICFTVIPYLLDSPS